MGRFSKILIMFSIFMCTLFISNYMVKADIVNDSGQRSMTQNSVRTENGIAQCNYVMNKNAPSSWDKNVCGKYQQIKFTVDAYTKKSGIFIVNPVSYNLTMCGGAEACRLKPTNFTTSNLNMNDYKKYFYKNKKWQCPTEVYYATSGSDTLMFFSKKDADNYVKGYRPENTKCTVKVSTEKNKDTNESTNNVVNQENAVVEARDIPTNNNDDIQTTDEQNNLTDTTAIKNWANGKKNGQFKKDNTNSRGGY